LPVEEPWRALGVYRATMRQTRGQGRPHRPLPLRALGRPAHSPMSAATTWCTCSESIDDWWTVITTIVAIAAFAAGSGARALYSRYRRRRWRRAQERALKEATTQQSLIRSANPQSRHTADAGHTADPHQVDLPALLRGWRTTWRPILSTAPRPDRPHGAAPTEGGGTAAATEIH
jgi:hypothetical protein